MNLCRVSLPPPGPRGQFIVGSLPAMQADWLGTMRSLQQQHGPVVRVPMPMGMKPMILISAVPEIEAVFATRAAVFRKPLMERVVAPILGDGLLLSERDVWRRQRRLANPSFHRQYIAQYAKKMAVAADAMLANWPEYGEREVYEDATDFALQVAASTMFGAELGPGARELGDVLSYAVDGFDAYFNSKVLLPPWLPTPTTRRMLEGAARLRNMICDLIKARRSQQCDGADLMGMLMSARDDQGVALTQLELLDQLVTLFLAGAETTAVSLAWTLQLLATHPDVAERVRIEIASVCGGAAPGPEHMRGLVLTTQVIKEAMRLYPPPWLLGREALEDCKLGGYDIEAGSQVYSCTYWLHRDPTYYPEPERFMPERWNEDLARSLPRFAYLPFGAGQRICIGQQFAMLELCCAVAAVLPRYELAPTKAAPELHPAFTLRPRGGLRLRMRRIDPAYSRTRAA